MTAPKFAPKMPETAPKMGAPKSRAYARALSQGKGPNFGAVRRSAPKMRAAYALRTSAHPNFGADGEAA